MTDRQGGTALLAAAAILILGAGGHAVYGWSVVREFAGYAPSDAGLVSVLGAGWQLGSVSLLAFGLVALTTGLARWRGRPVASPPITIVAGTLAGFGAGALLLGSRQFAHFYLGYILIAVLLILGSRGRGKAGAT